jgi:hypothetical protein
MALTFTSVWVVSGILCVAYATYRFLDNRRKRAIGKERLGYVVRFAEAAGFKLIESEIDPEDRSTSLTYEHIASDNAHLYVWITQGLDTVHVRVGTLARGEWRWQEKWTHSNATASAFADYIERAEWCADQSLST